MEEYLQPDKQRTSRKRKEPVRMCAVCRERFFKSELTRFVQAGQQDSEISKAPDQKGSSSIEVPDGLIIDPAQRLSGRGIYICASPQCRKKFGKFRLPKKKSTGR